MRLRVFTVPEANRLIPRLEKIVSMIEEAQAQLHEAKERFSATSEKSPSDHPERIRLSHNVEIAEHEFLTALDKIIEMGCSMKAGGLVDFYTVKDGALYELCWQKGEEEIRFYHEYMSGFIGRRPIIAGDIAVMGVPNAARTL